MARPSGDAKPSRVLAPRAVPSPAPPATPAAGLDDTGAGACREGSETVPRRFREGSEKVLTGADAGAGAAGVALAPVPRRGSKENDDSEKEEDRGKWDFKKKNMLR